jgi:hypothetical protein
MFLMHAAVALGKMKRHFTGVVNTAHGLFRTAFLQESLSSAPARIRDYLISTVDFVQLVATCYKYSRRSKVLFLISTVGDGDMTDGSPFIQRWANERGNIATRAILRSHVVSTYF